MTLHQTEKPSNIVACNTSDLLLKLKHQMSQSLRYETPPRVSNILMTDRFRQYSLWLGWTIFRALIRSKEYGH